MNKNAIPFVKLVLRLDNKANELSRQANVVLSLAFCNRNQQFLFGRFEVN